MTPAELRQIAAQGDPGTMAEALRQVAAGQDDDETYGRMRVALSAPALSIRFLTLLWQHRGQLVGHERIEERLGIYGRESIRSAKRRLMPALKGLPVEIRPHYHDGYSLHAWGPVPWERSPK
ncbi:hypothetical protein [Limimaricola sp.]|uniref:hypothetical protein n=1 Tax=Limimaricola sp. TaxID=2211665 RepID=UPI00405A1DC9